MEEETIRQIEQILGYKFIDTRLLDKAFTHSSAVDNRFHSNERLEFFGDSVLCIVICHALLERFPDFLEGDLTKMKSMLVSRKTCARVIKDLDLHKFLKIGKGMTRSRSISGSLAAGLFEAIVAAIYIDGGYEAARDFILRNFDAIIDEASTEQAQGNFKSLLQQYAQQQYNITPSYELLDEKGPDHDKCFEVEAVVAARHFTSAWGTNKKDAEQKAAYNALIELGVIERLPEDSP